VNMNVQAELIFEMLIMNSKGRVAVLIVHLVSCTAHILSNTVIR
jgi:hypothetical protein